MHDIQLLDCTLRDGGYLNDWKFGKRNLISIFERLADSGVDIIEIGFLDERRPFDTERSIMPDTKSADAIFGTLDKKKSMVVGMIDYGTCSIRKLSLCEDSFLDGIRVIFKKHLMHEAMDFCRQVKEMGYKVFSQLVSITTYSDEELLELIKLVNDVKPYAVSMVDTYGLLHPEELLHYYDILDDNVYPDIKIGFHAHNNLQLAYANSLTFLNKEKKHDIIVDGTLYGMGKSAGNTPIELLSMRLNEKFNKNYNIHSMLEAIDESVRNFQYSFSWGYNTFFYLCSKNRCHPNYVTYFQEKQNLSSTKLDEILSMIDPEDKKLLYDKLVAEHLYNKYTENIPENESLELLHKEFINRKLLLIGPGKNIYLQKEKVQEFIEKNNPYIISINYVPENIDSDCIFITNIKRYHEMTLALRNTTAKTLATSNVECKNGTFDFIINRAPLLEKSEKINDNSFLMILKLLKKIGIKEVNCSGFDGYSDKEDNYYNPNMEYYFVKQEASNLNYHMKKCISELRENMNINFITYSAYDVTEDINSASI